MAVNSAHPLYSEFLSDWSMMRDTYRGERVIKSKRETYLPATTGMVQDGMSKGRPGYIAYNAYIIRAVFHELVSDAIEAMLGVMHHKPPTIELPSKLEPMRKNATVNGESLEVLLRRINEEQLVTGRLGLLLDVIDQAPVGVLPYVAIYKPEAILNWDDGTRDDPLKQTLNLVVLDESEYERSQGGFEWDYKEKYRVLVLGDIAVNETVGNYKFAVFNDKSGEVSEAVLNDASIGGKRLDEIPFMFINSKDIVPDPDDPPLTGLARLALAIYRGEADYRQNLFLQGQDTLVISGGNEKDEYRLGAGATLNLPLGADAKFIGVTSDGLKEQREALVNDKGDAIQKGGHLLDNKSREAESGEALKIRVAARTASMNQIALTGAFGLQQLLQIAARWVGANPDEVVVTPNLDFTADGLTGRELLDLTAAKNMGAPMSRRSLHKIMQDKDLTDMTYEEEISEIEGEEPILGGTDAGGNSEDDEEQGDNADV